GVDIFSGFLCFENSSLRRPKDPDCGKLVRREQRRHVDIAQLITMPGSYAAANEINRIVALIAITNQLNAQSRSVVLDDEIAGRIGEHFEVASDQCWIKHQNSNTGRLTCNLPYLCGRVCVPAL